MKAKNLNHIYESIPLDEEQGINPSRQQQCHSFSSCCYYNASMMEDEEKHQRDPTLLLEWKSTAMVLCAIAISMAVVAAVLGIYAFEHEKDVE